MDKYELLYHQLLYEGIVDLKDVNTPGLLRLDLLEGIHTSEYLSSLLSLELSEREQKVSGFIHSSELIERELTIMEGTRLAAELALIDGCTFNIAGGTHHAFSDRGEGFCLLNDQAIAARWLQVNTDIKRVLIVDLDVHQGNGTAQIFSGNDSVYTFSMHGKNNYPIKKERSNLDIELPDGILDEEYIEILDGALKKIISEFEPDFVFYQSGVDVLSSDKLGRLGLSVEGCKKRDERIYSFASSLKIPIVTTMGGGYSPNVNDIVTAHCNTFKTASNFYF
jgi:acetoin utilization deacetylase AcuC-like enzyme